MHSECLIGSRVEVSGLDFYVLSPGSPDVTDFVQWGATRTYSFFDGESVRIGDSSTHESEVESEVLDRYISVAIQGLQLASGVESKSSPGSRTEVHRRQLRRPRRLPR